MVNEEKIRLMTKLAIYEENDGKKEIPLASYFLPYSLLLRQEYRL